MNNAAKTYVVSAPPPPKRTVTVLNGGANRGAKENLAAFADFNLSSVTTAITPVYTDPVPGRALALKDEAERQGTRAGAIEGKVEDIVKAVAGASSDPIVLHLDRASGVASVLREADGIDRAILGYLLVKIPNGRLYGFRYVLEPKDGIARAAAITLFETLALVSERNTSESIFGEGADPVHALLEPGIRKWFAEHTKANLAKILAGLEPTSNTFEITTDGQETLPLFVAIRQAWSDPAVLAQDVVRNPAFPIRKGVHFMIAEVLHGEGIRFHDVRRRSDDRITVNGAEIIDHASVNEAAREAAKRQQATLQRPVSGARLTLANPIWTTD